MSYKLISGDQVQHIESGAWIPVRYESDKLVKLDEYSPFVTAFEEWLKAGNTPLPADPQPIPAQASLSDGDLATLLVAKGVLKQSDVDTAVAAAAASSATLT